MIGSNHPIAGTARYGLSSLSAKLICLFLLCITSTSAALALPNWFNVVFIISDDQGAWAMGYNNPEIRTPNLDALAAGGARFRNAFATSPVCSPVRATLLTGRIPSQHGIHAALPRPEDFGPYAKPLLDNEVTYSDILAQYGYTLGISGKWHLGDSLHAQKGFDFWSVIPHGGSTYNNAPMIRDGKVEKVPGYLTEVITDQALEFLQTNRERAFFLLVNYTAPHSPYDGHPQRYVDLYRDTPFNSIPREGVHPWANATASNIGNRETLAKYFAAVTAMDENVGRITEYLKKSGLAERTLVVFMSDQGHMVGHHGLWGKGNASEPKNLFDDSLRVPLIFYHPGQIPAGQIINNMVSQYDFFPTLLDYLGINFPATGGAPPVPAYQGRNLPGRSYASLLKGQAVTWENVVYAEYGMVRMVRTEWWKYVRRYPNGPDELYNLQKDPRERKNLVSEADMVERVQELRKKLEEWFRRYAEPDKDPPALRRDPTGKFKSLHPLRYPGYPQKSP